MGKLAEIKTKQTSASVTDFIAGIADEQKRKDTHVIVSLWKKLQKKSQRCGVAQ